ncbi:MAG TPA: hypothetical protein PLU53_04090 [Bacteroidia bacterium]|nr:hypothetical protein [Bacteroidia bacterium]
MKVNTAILLLSLCMIQVGSDSCSEQASQTGNTIGPEKVIKLSDAGSHLPERPGNDHFLANCGICHSYRYVEMQPPFPRKTWEKTVDKMIHTFGAPIPDSSVKPIVDYLMAVRGKE